MIEGHGGPAIDADLLIERHTVPAIDADDHQDRCLRRMLPSRSTSCEAQAQDGPAPATRLARGQERSPNGTFFTTAEAPLSQ